MEHAMAALRAAGLPQLLVCSPIRAARCVPAPRHWLTGPQPALHDNRPSQRGGAGGAAAAGRQGRRADRGWLMGGGGAGGWRGQPEAASAARAMAGGAQEPAGGGEWNSLVPVCDSHPWRRSLFPPSAAFPQNFRPGVMEKWNVRAIPGGERALAQPQHTPSSGQRRCCPTQLRHSGNAPSQTCFLPCSFRRSWAQQTSSPI